MSAKKERRNIVQPGEGPKRRMGDRRDSPRIPLILWVRQVDAGGSFAEKSGDIGVGGAYFEDRFLPVGKVVELRFRLPRRDPEYRCQGEIIRISELAGKFGAHVKFVEMDTECELAIAKFIDDQELANDE